MSFEYLKKIIGIPKGGYSYVCPTCSNDFKTKYIQQVFCLSPCTAHPKKLGKKEAEKMTRAENLARKKEIDKKQTKNRDFNRKWLSMKL